jgi:hypothetical protein
MQRRPGGGWCYNYADCFARSQTTLGSSNAYPPTFLGEGVLSSDPQVNPDFHTWNAIHFNYCDGGSYAGNADEPVVYNGAKLWFRGRRNLDAYIDSLNDLGLSQATHVLVAGCSAGGLATYLHADYVASRMPTSAVVKAMPISGFFLDYESVVNGTSVYGTQLRNVFSFMNCSGSVNQGCIAANAGNEDRCMFAQWTWPHVQTPIMPMNSLYDSWSLQCILTATLAPEQCAAAPGWGPCFQKSPAGCTADQVHDVKLFGNTMLSLFASAPTFAAPSNGVFLDSCIGHCESDNSDIDGPQRLGAWSGMSIRGIDATTAIGNWYFERVPPGQSLHIDCLLNDDAPYACNPTCGQ